MAMEIGAIQVPGADIGAVQSSVAVAIQISGSFTSFINGKDNKNQELDLFVHGLTIENNNIDLFISGPIITINNIDLFISSLDVFSNNLEFFIHGFDSLTNNLTLFINTQTPIIVSEEYEYSTEVSIIGDFETGKNVTIELWKNGILQVITSNICNEIGNTGKYAWSLSNITSINKKQVRYFWRMTDNLLDVVEGTFILKSIVYK